MKKFLLSSILASVFLLVVAAGIAFYWFSQNLLPVSTSQTKTSFVVQENEVASSVLLRLEAAGLIKSSRAARLYLRISGNPYTFAPGAYVLTPNKPLADQLASLTNGPVDVWVTFPEGWRREQIGVRLAATLTGPDAKFDLTEFLSLTQNLEGQLFPDTYLVPNNATAADIVRILTANFTKKTGLSLPQDTKVLILASLVERESRIPEERPIIAGILTNRLQSDWLLNVDATIQYARDTTKCAMPSDQCKYWNPILDTKFASDYNTYIYTGLPPTPICNPGLNSIQAAKNPATTPYFYYLHDTKGAVHYARTLPEHNLNVDKYLRP